MANHLWVYGTLLSPIGSAFGKELAQMGHLLGPGWARGHLFDLGDYPAFAYDEFEGARIRGEIWQLTDPAAAFSVLDPYENYDPGKPAKENLYVREQHPIEAEDGPLSCWIYTYHGQLHGLPLIEDSDYFSYWRKNPRHQSFTRYAD